VYMLAENDRFHIGQAIRIHSRFVSHQKTLCEREILEKAVMLLR